MSKANRNPSYADIIRKIMRERDITRRDIEKATGFSYEHVRKVVSGQSLQSENFNDKLCAFLSLNRQEMWSIACREKIQKHGPQMFAMAQPDLRLKQIWEGITIADQESLLKIGEGMLELRRVEKGEQEEDDPEALHQRILQLMNRLTKLKVQASVQTSGALLGRHAAASAGRDGTV